MTCDLQVLERLLGWRLRGLTDHVDFEDLEQECRIAAWRAVAAHTGGCSANRLMITAIDAEAVDFLRSPMNRTRTSTRHGGVRVRPVTLDFNECHGTMGHQTHRTHGWPYPEPEPRMPDFVEPLLDRAYARWVWSMRGAVLNPRESAVLAATVLAAEPAVECAKRQARSPAAVWAEKRGALARYREWLLGQP